MIIMNLFSFIRASIDVIKMINEHIRITRWVSKTCIYLKHTICNENQSLGS